MGRVETTTTQRRQSPPTSRRTMAENQGGNPSDSALSTSSGHDGVTVDSRESPDSVEEKRGGVEEKRGGVEERRGSVKEKSVNVDGKHQDVVNGGLFPPGDAHRPSYASLEQRRSLSYALRATAPVYYDSRAATRTEWQRRAKTLDEYYDDNPHLLPQLPFTWHHGWRRWRLFLFAFLVFVDGSALPIALYYGMRYAGHVEGWIIFAVITTIWGGPTYVEFAVRTLRLMKRERFYRPLGTDSRWCFDVLNWASVVTITAVTALFIVGSAPHEVWLRVLCMPAPAILYCMGGTVALLTLFHAMGWPAPFRISSTGRGDTVLPGAYYFVEDIVAVNAAAGRPYREALAARYRASRRFRRMLYVQSLFWSVPALVLAAALTAVAVTPDVPATGAYGVCWAVPFLWSALWGGLTVWWCGREMAREKMEWDEADGRLANGSDRIRGMRHMGHGEVRD